jgi:L-lysine exporter family protein LysE/ArgO
LNAVTAGLVAGLGLIVAIGAQNAFVIRQGLAKSHVLLVVLICAASDTVLIVAGVGGLGIVIQALPWLLVAFKVFGSGYLIWFGIKSTRSAIKAAYLENQTTGKAISALKVATTCLMFTWLNPHVYLDTVIFLGGIANQFATQLWWFALGSSLASWLWFAGIGFGAQAASKWMSKPAFWRVLDSVIAVLMFALAAMLIFS